MGVIVDVNIDALDPLGHGNKNLNQVGVRSYFARNIISTRGLIMKRLLDTAGAWWEWLFWELPRSLLHRLLSWNLRTCILDRPVLERMAAVLPS